MIYKTLKCPYCNGLHIDKDKLVNVVHNGVVMDRKINFFKTPHRKHTCEHCLKTFLDPQHEKSVSIVDKTLFLGLKL